MRRVLHAGQTPRPLQERGHKIVVPTVVTAGAREAVGKDAAFPVFAKGLAHKGARCVVVALAVELACAGEIKPSLKVLGNGLVQQGTLRVARAVEFGFG